MDFSTPLSTVPDGPDVGISLPTLSTIVSDWLAAEAVECHIKFTQ